MDDKKQQVITSLVVDLLSQLDPNAKREGLQETPKRVAKAWGHWTQGYEKEKDLDSIFKVFEDGGEGYEGMVVCSPIPFYSHCEHHLAPFFGTATVAYIPNGRVVGLSKLSRVVDVYAQRLQVQERLTVQIADCIDRHLKPVGVGVFLTARHLCMESRGINRQGIHTHTTVLRGAMRTDAATRAEFLRLTSLQT